MDRALRAVGDLLERREERAAIVVVGGTALNLLGVVDQITRDVDVLAIATADRAGEPRDLRPPDPLPSALQETVATVARDLGLPPDWFNTTVAMQWKTGLPPRLQERVRWRRYGGLRKWWTGSSRMFKQRVLKAIAELRAAAARTAWIQWATIFTVPVTRRRARAIVDPEALLLGSLAVGDEERRLATVTGSWARDHSALLSVQRAKNLSRQFSTNVGEELARFAVIALHEGGDLRWRSLAAGSMRIAAAPGRRKHGNLVLEGPGSIMLRLRLGLGVGIKPDAVAYLIGRAGGRTTVQQIAEATAYHPRAVRRSIEELAAAGFIEPRPTAPVSYRLDERKWAGLLAFDPNDPPAWRSWVAFYAFVAALSHWAQNPPGSDFVLASEARDLLLKFGSGLEGTVQLPSIEGTRGEAVLPLFLDAVQACTKWAEEVV